MTLWHYCFRQKLIRLPYLPSILLCLFISGCVPEPDIEPIADENPSTSQPELPTNPVDDDQGTDDTTDGIDSDTPDDVVDLPTSDCLGEHKAGKSIWVTQCAECHGSNNEGGAFAPVTGTDRSQLILATFKTMPYGKSELCDNQCATEVIDYLLATQNESCDAAPETALFNSRPLSETLHSAAFNLASRLPTDEEIEWVSKKGQQGLENALADMMNEEAFAERIMEIYSDLIQVEQFSPNHEHSDGILDISFGEAGIGRWYDDVGDRDYQDHVAVIRSHVREPLQLVKHVVKENKDFREILTADYTMVNNLNGYTYAPYKTSQFDFKNLGEYTPKKVTARPQAGILGSVAFTHKHQSTDANRNRKRAVAVFDLFLDTDIRSLGGEVVAAADAEDATNVLTDPQCKSCHTIMDPVASAFKNYNNEGYYRANRNWHDDMADPGLAGKKMSGNEEPLVWLAGEIANDPRFARATVKTLFSGLFGQNVLRISPASLPEQIAVYEIQQAYIEPWAKLFIQSNYNVRALVKTMIVSDYYQASSLNSAAFSRYTNGLSSDQKVYVQERVGGSTTQLTPEMLARKIGLLTENYVWGQGNSLYKGILDPLNVDNGIAVLYGGIDFKDNTERLRDINGFMLAVQERMSYDIACEAMDIDFAKSSSKRLLFPNVNLGQAPQEQSSEMKALIADAMWTLWGQSYNEDSTEVSTAYNLLLNIYNQNTRDNPSSYDCHRTSGTGRHLKMALTGMLSYLLSDYRFNNL